MTLIIPVMPDPMFSSFVNKHPVIAGCIVVGSILVAIIAVIRHNKHNDNDTDNPSDNSDDSEKG